MLNITQSSTTEWFIYTEPSISNPAFLLAAYNESTCKTVYFNAANTADEDCTFLIFEITEVGEGGVEDLDNGEVRLSPSGDWTISVYEQTTGSTNKDPNLATFLKEVDLNVISDGECYQSPSGTGGVCDPATVENSDTTYQVNVSSGSTLILPDITHTDSDASPSTLPAQTAMVCTPCILQDLYDAATSAQTSTVIETNTEAAKIAYRRPIYTGETLIYRTGADGWQAANGTFDYTHQGKRPVLQVEDPAARDGTFNDYSMLSPLTPNAFGNTNVWTNSKGAQIYDGSDGSIATYAINHVDGFGYWIQRIGSTINWNNAIDTAHTSVLGGFNDWRLVNKKTLENLIVVAAVNVFGYTPITGWIGGGITILWTSNTSFTGAVDKYTIDSAGIVAKTNRSVTANLGAVMCRNHY